MFFDRLLSFLTTALAYHKNSFYTLLNKTGCVLKYYNNKTERNFLKRFSQTLTYKILSCYSTNNYIRNYIR
ncbi:hypothetical protein HG560_07120 [Helicobacter pylori]|uniref:Uncharacterized protein n=1 Tax=Helicobacter pylori TaxID=210 RepID=A0AAE7P5G5_HELPX|nr:hypothetical protein HG560_05560 [Helicobacter pylori]QQW94240.1 hypothetical protein HG560_07120 [Helicobacter pylori]QQX49935.1 hypothetical protein HG562_05575 [Helicobacter pylori]QQX50207.1 hypothetical protein HG562_07140 [Helicobacter pylori]